MTVASALLQRHIETLLSPGEWETLIADDILWELPFAPALGHPGRLEGREAVETHVKWFRGAVENFRLRRTARSPFFASILTRHGRQRRWIAKSSDR
jgi:hypothetical protein